MHKTNNWKTDYLCLCFPAYLENHQLTKRSLSLKCLWRTKKGTYNNGKQG